MNKNRLSDYLDHIRQAASDACGFIEGLNKPDFLTDKRTQQAVILSLTVIGEAAIKVMDQYPELTSLHQPAPDGTVAKYARDAQSHCTWLF